MESNSETIGNIDKFVDPNEVYYHQQRLKRIHRSLRIYQNSWLEDANAPNHTAILWSDKPPFDLTWTRFLNSSLLDFREVGFTSYIDFYSLPREVRDSFLQKQRDKLELSFPELGKEFLEGNQIPSESRHKNTSPTKFVKSAHNYYRELQRAAFSTKSPGNPNLNG
ncbi:MAG: hypothetical protein ACTSVZ_01630 [Promethearchaeota archaeon]